MHKSSLLEILRTFSKKEPTSFDEFLRSPFHNKNSTAIKLYGIIRKFAPDFTSDALAKEKVWEKLYPGKPFNYGVLKNLIFEVSKLAENFMAITFFKSSDAYEENLILSMKERKISGLMLKKIISFEKKLEKLPFKDEDYLLRKFRLSESKIGIFANEKLYDAHREEAQSYLIQYFLIKYFSGIFNFYVDYNNRGRDFDKEFLNILLNYFRDKIKMFNDTPLVKIYFSALESLADTSNEKLYFNTYKLFRENHTVLEKSVRENIYTVLQLICNLSRFNKNFDYNKESFNLYKDMVNDNSLVDSASEKIDLNTYRNVLLTASALGKTGFMKNFRDEYYDKVKTGDKEHIKKYSDAMIFFAQKNYAKCFEVTSKIEFNKFFDSVSDSFFFKIDVKGLAIICCYELEYYESFLNVSEACRRFLTNVKKEELGRSQPYLDFIKYFGRLVKYRLDNEKNNLGLLKKEVESHQAFFGKKYLLKKIDEFMG